MFTYIILVFIMAFRADDPYDDPDPNAVSSHSQFVAAVEDMTDNGDNTYTYDDGEISLTFEKYQQMIWKALLKKPYRLIIQRICPTIP